jgi:hypothetical protein
MGKFQFDVNPDDLMQLMLEAIGKIDPDDLAYLFATGKSELEIRNAIALHMHRSTEGNQVVSREWRRHDLAVLEFGQPRIVIEGKAWIHADAANPQKLTQGDKSVRQGLENDLKKLEATREEFPNVSAFVTTILFTVDLQGASSSHLNEAQVKYANTHLRGIKSHEGAEELAGRGRGALSELLNDYGVVKRHPLNVGQYLRFPVEADFFLLQPMPNKGV